MRSDSRLECGQKRDIPLDKLLRFIELRRWQQIVCRIFLCHRKWNRLHSAVEQLLVLVLQEIGQLVSTWPLFEMLRIY